MNNRLDKKPIISILGGTGSLGGGLAYRWAKSGYSVIIGSRDAAAAEQAAEKLRQKVNNACIQGMENRDAAAAAEVLVLSVPYAHQEATLKHVYDVAQGKIFVDTTVSLKPPRVDRVQLPEEGSAGIIAQSLLGDSVYVVSAFQNIAAAHLSSDHPIHCDVLVTANNSDAAQIVVDMAKDISLTAWYAGPISNSVATEALTSLLITLNKRYEIDGAGIVITGEPSIQ